MTTATQPRYEVTREVPPHLKPFIAEQHYDMYTAIDQAVWRFIMTIANRYYDGRAHEKYLYGLAETGLSTERIPRVEEMDEKLQRFGWRAVPIVGFIPPAAFLEFGGYGLLGIACDIRQRQNVSYTPAPDIVHEAAGHAPIIADQHYADFLRKYGKLATKAIFSKENWDEYWAVRKLSDLKENPESAPEEIEQAQKELEETFKAHSYDSEVDWVGRYGWWTFEFGLVGDINNPKLYGAGLLSSIGEGLYALTGIPHDGPADGQPLWVDGKKRPKLIPLSVDCIHRDFDITDMQPQYYVARDFDHLFECLEDLAAKLSYTKGGVHGLEVAKRGQTVNTVQLDSGVQIGGILTDFRLDDHGRPFFLKFGGAPSQLAYEDVQLDGHGAAQHEEGFSAPVGPLRDGKNPADLTEADLKRYGFTGDHAGTLEFASGITLSGTLTGSVRRNEKSLVFSFKNCSVKLGDEVLFNPDWGLFDLACGVEIPHVYGGAPDRWEYLKETKGEDYKETASQSSNVTESNKDLVPLYAKVREIREAGTAKERVAELNEIYETLKNGWPEEWLLVWELLELNHKYELGAPWADEAHKRVAEIAETNEIDGPNIKRGLALVGGPPVQ